MDRLIARAIAPLARRIRLLAARAVIRLVDDGLKEQDVQIDLLSGETRRAERYQHYGFTSHPHPGAEAVALSINGSRDHMIVIADGDRRYRIKSTAAGEVAIYDDQGQAVHLKRDRTIHVYGADAIVAEAAVSAGVTAPAVTVTASAQVFLDTPLLTVSGALRVVGDITDNYGAGGVSMQSMRDAYEIHTHPGDSGGTTGTPNQSMYP